MSKVDPNGYYASLGVEPWATADQIRTAFHRGARLYHPDHNPSPQAKARFQAINEAYRTLRARQEISESRRWLPSTSPCRFSQRAELHDPTKRPFRYSG